MERRPENLRKAREMSFLGAPKSSEKLASVSEAFRVLRWCAIALKKACSIPGSRGRVVEEGWRLRAARHGQGATGRRREAARATGDNDLIKIVFIREKFEEYFVVPVVWRLKLGEGTSSRVSGRRGYGDEEGRGEGVQAEREGIERHGERYSPGLL